MEKHAENTETMELVAKDVNETEELATAESVQVISKINGFINTLDIDSDEGKLKTIAAYNGAQSLTSKGDEVFNLEDVITIPGVRKSRNISQPNTPCTNTYLITTDGEAFFTQSDGIADSVGMIVAMYPDLNKPDGLKVRVQETITANGNTLKRLIPQIS